jgi:hypothetical protein
LLVVIDVLVEVLFSLKGFTELQSVLWGRRVVLYHLLWWLVKLGELSGGRLPWLRA